MSKECLAEGIAKSEGDWEKQAVTCWAEVEALAVDTAYKGMKTKQVSFRLHVSHRTISELPHAPEF